MAPRFYKAVAGLSLLAAALTPVGHAKELRITIPRFSSLTPVQQLNRAGVEAIRRHQLEKAQALFFKAYLYDPGDPFTLNNLGYSAELSGDADRAEQFYKLAAKQDCTAVISVSSLERIQGKPMNFALQDFSDKTLQLNRFNVEAIELLTHDRSFEAAALLRHALTLDPSNPFTLNNLAVAEESDGDLEGAVRDFQAAVDTQSTADIVIAPERRWRGKPITTLAADSLKRVQKRLKSEGLEQAQATLLTVNGVRALNANNWESARQDFQQAYTLDPTSAFSLNNLGYVAERDGDPEAAQYYYANALRAANANATIGMASSNDAEGKRLSRVGAKTVHTVDARIDAYSRSQREAGGLPALILRKPETQQRSAPATPQPH